MEHFGVELPFEVPPLTPEIIQRIYSGSYEREEAEMLEISLRSDGVVLEVGTGLGFTAVLATRKVGDASMTTWEANQDRFNYIRKVFEINKVNPELCLGAVSTLDVPSVKFFLGAEAWGDSLFTRRGPTSRFVPNVAFTTVLGTRKPSYLLLDCEGVEVDLLAEELPSHVRTVLVEWHPHIVDEELCFKAAKVLVRSGFELLEEREGRGKRIGLFSRDQLP